jgi:hypothetical protein
MNYVPDWIRAVFKPVTARRKARTASDYPATSAVSADNPSHRPRVFDPALLHYTRAFRVGAPAFDDVAQAQRWRLARRRAAEHVLSATVHSPFAEHLVLRGSVLMRAWFGDEAREPGDIDWTIVPETILKSDAWSAELSKHLASVVADGPEASAGIRFDAAAVAVDDIWTYDRAPGTRIVYPWRATDEADADLPAGAVQCDFVFGEALPSPPVRTPIPLLDAPEPLHVLAADLHASLAWKLLWLETDQYPQGKDLYDAVLLAERARETNQPLPHDVLLQTLKRSPDFRREPLPPDFPLQWTVDWENFRKEHPQVSGDAREWQARLTAGLASTFA